MATKTSEEMAEKEVKKGTSDRTSSNAAIRYIAAAFLIIVIVSMGFVIYKNKYNIFRQDIMIDYPDGCQEKYTDGILVTPNCTKGRLLLENGSTPIWNINPNHLVLNNNLTNLQINLS